MIRIGIDPGWASFGVAVSQEGILLSSSWFIPKESGDISTFLNEELFPWLRNTLYNVEEGNEIEVVIERFVTYANVQTDPENILMVIGALAYAFENKALSDTPAKVILVKAIDWKVKACHNIVKTKGASNPYRSLDKKFSVWAASQLSGIDVVSNHEADAICISYYQPPKKKVP